MKNRKPRIINRNRPPIEKGAHYLSKKICEPVLNPAGIQAELERRKELSDTKTELARQLRMLKSSEHVDGSP